MVVVSQRRRVISGSSVDFVEVSKALSLGEVVAKGHGNARKADPRLKQKRQFASFLILSTSIWLAS
jgi:hypothetical protein